MTIQKNILLAPYTVYKIGGPTRFFVEVKTVDEVIQALNYAAEMRVPFFILGAGSNILVSDKGFDGMVIRMRGGEARIQGEHIQADAGVAMARAVREVTQRERTGFEWGIGIPGTIGGSVRGNAGCFGGEMKDVIEKVSIFNFQFSKKEELQNNQCQFGYRDSIFKRHPEWIILSATLKLAKGDADLIQKKVNEITAQRIRAQDIGTHSCGCIFKNAPWPREAVEREDLLKRFAELEVFLDQPNIPVSFLIDRAGLKGKRIGNVSISSKHANFFVNEGGATACDVRALIEVAKKKVREKFGVTPEEEIQLLGF